MENPWEQKMATLTAQDATWSDHNEMIFWLWAALKTGERFLHTSHELSSVQKAMFAQPMEKWGDHKAELNDIKSQSTLESHQFLNALGVLLRVLQRSQHLFPTVQPPYSRANHTITEGKLLRDLVEHAYGKDGYLAGGGKMKDKFVKEEAGMAADAVSLIVKDDGHWLGNRLCVERSLEEIRAIQIEALKVPAPSIDDQE
jgi:hypothetical protein